MYNNLSEVLLTEEQIQARVKEMAAQLSKEYAGKDPVFVGVLRGVVVFFSDIIRNFTEPCQIDFMCVSPTAAPSPPASASSPRMLVWSCVTAM